MTPLTSLDDAPVAASVNRTVDAWDAAWIEAMHFVGDPFVTLADANAGDTDFAMGSVFCATYRALGGSSFDAPELMLDLERARERAVSGREAAHLEALELLVAGNFTDAARRWDRVADENVDFAAVRFAHDLYLHVGDVERRVASGERARSRFGGRLAEPYVTGQHAFSLEEAGAYDEAERLGWEALDANPLDLWALHALAHVYESTNNQDAALGMLCSRADTWTAQDGLAVHVHWHHALRMIAGGRFDDAVKLFDCLVPDAQTPFRLSDLASLLWRLEHVGVDVGDRWLVVADRLAARPERHTNGFLDLHMALAFQRVPSHSEAPRFFDGVGPSHAKDNSENGETFRQVVVPLVEAIRIAPQQPVAAAVLIDSVADRAHCIGGSIAQRDLITITRNALIEPMKETP